MREKRASQGPVTDTVDSLGVILVGFSDVPYGTSSYWPNGYLKVHFDSLFFSNDWYYYNHKCVVFKPKHMTPDELREGYQHVMKSFYSFSGIARHFAWSLGMTPVIPKRILFFLLWNIAHRTLHTQIDGVPDPSDSVAATTVPPGLLARQPRVSSIL